MLRFGPCETFAASIGWQVTIRRRYSTKSQGIQLGLSLHLEMRLLVLVRTSDQPDCEFEDILLYYLYKIVEAQHYYYY
jgi:hypothetical protein